MTPLAGLHGLTTTMTLPVAPTMKMKTVLHIMKMVVTMHLSTTMVLPLRMLAVIVAAEHVGTRPILLLCSITAWLALPMLSQMPVPRQLTPASAWSGRRAILRKETDAKVAPEIVTLERTDVIACAMLAFMMILVEASKRSSSMQLARIRPSARNALLTQPLRLRLSELPAAAAIVDTTVGPKTIPRLGETVLAWRVLTSLGLMRRRALHSTSHIALVIWDTPVTLEKA